MHTMIDRRHGMTHTHTTHTHGSYIDDVVIPTETADASRDTNCVSVGCEFRSNCETKAMAWMTSSGMDSKTIVIDF